MTYIQRWQQCGGGKSLGTVILDYYHIGEINLKFMNNIFLLALALENVK